MVRSVVAEHRPPPPKALPGRSAALDLPLATSGGILNVDFGGRARKEESVAELIERERGPLVDDDGNAKKVPVLRDGYWTMADATEAKRHRGVGLVNDAIAGGITSQTISKLAQFRESPLHANICL